MNLKSSCNDKVCLLKSNGEKHDDILAMVQSKIIFIPDSSVPIEEGDKLTRVLPNGLEEVYEVTDRGYFGSHAGLESHYQAKVKKVLNGKDESNIKGDSGHEIHITGNNSPVTINSKDNYINFTINGINDENLFEELRKYILKNVDVENKEKILSSVDNLEKAKGTNGYTKAFKSFVQVSKDGMTILGPFIPYLSDYLK
ncbi:MAG: hypothetical protein ACYDEF_08545 [Methanosarcina sp.]